MPVTTHRPSAQAHGPLDEHALLVVACEALEVLKACHSNGILYGEPQQENGLLLLSRLLRSASDVEGMGSHDGPLSRLLRKASDVEGDVDRMSRVMVRLLRHASIVMVLT